jgi:hypothetical protein
MRSSLWSDYVPPGEVPDSFPLFGANVIHTRASEDQPEDSCPGCGGIHVAPNGKVIAHRGEADPVEVVEAHVTLRGEFRPYPLEFICGNCGRSRYDETSAMRRAVKPEDGKIRDGYEHLDGADTDKSDRDERTARAVSSPQPERGSPAKRKGENPAGLLGVNVNTGV